MLINWYHARFDTPCRSEALSVVNWPTLMVDACRRLPFVPMHDVNIQSHARIYILINAGLTLVYDDPCVYQRPVDIYAESFPSGTDQSPCILCLLGRTHYFTMD